MRLLFAILSLSLAAATPADAKLVRYELTARQEKVNLSGKKEVDFALTVNGGIPAPTLEFTEGDDAEIVVKNEIPFGPAVQRGVMCEPPAGVPELEPVLAAAQGLGVELFAIVEQDMYPCEPDKPLPIAVRTRKFLRSCGA